MDRLERLLNLVAALIDTPRLLTAEELGTRVPGYPEPHAPAFKRAFERDKATLRDMGIPIDVVDIQPGNPESPVGYRIRRDRYELQDPGLEPDEVAALHVAATQVRLEGGDASAAVWKLGGVPAGGEVSPEEAARVEIPGAEHLPTLFTAVAERRPLTFPYKGSKRSVEPWHLEFRNGAWYLIAWDRDHAEQRTYRVDRFDGSPEAGPAASFERPAHRGPVPTHVWEMGDEAPVDVDVLVDAGQAEWAAANAGSPATWHDDGAVVLRLRVTNRAGLRSWVLGFLDHAEIIGPAAERDAFAAWLGAFT